jgi:hypothetical protein
MSKNLIRNIRLLKSKSALYERTDINGKVDERFRAKYFVKFFIYLFSFTFFFFLRNGFSEDFVSYTSSSLSIIVGLFITAMIFSFDKFYQPIEDVSVANSRDKQWNIQAYNYSKKFAYITGYTIVLSVYALVFLSISALFKEESSLDVIALNFDFSKIDGSSIWLFFLGTFFVFQRIMVMYWLIKIIYNTLFIVSSMVQYMTTKIER